MWREGFYGGSKFPQQLAKIFVEFGQNVRFYECSTVFFSIHMVFWWDERTLYFRVLFPDFGNGPPPDNSFQLILVPATTFPIPFQKFYFFEIVPATIEFALHHS